MNLTEPASNKSGQLIRRMLQALFATAGIALIGLAVLAYRLGIDNNPEWGGRRVALVALGLWMLIWAVWDRIEVRVMAGLRLIADVWRNLPANQATSRLRAWVRRRYGTRFHEARPVWVDRYWMEISLAVLGVFAVFAYLWIFTAGTLTEWPRGSRYFYLLGQAFSSGQLHLLEEPSPQLLAVENPYYYKERGNVPVIWDALFYQGKYYLYWGPVPGLLVAALQPFSSKMIRDPFLVLVFMLGAFWAGAALLRAIWRRFPLLPPGMFIGGLCALAFNGPLLWLLTRPKVYEAAIAGGQFFLMGGIYWAFTGVQHARPSPRRLVLAGFFLAMAAATRINLALAIAFLVFLVIGRILWLSFGGPSPDGQPVDAGPPAGGGMRAGPVQRLRSSWRPALGACLAFGVPLLLGAAGLMTYNQLRFGGPFDFGYRYLITGPTIPQDPARTSSIDYILPNLYTYFLRLPEFRGQFPYLVVPWIKPDMWPFFIDLPPDYFYTEPVSSLLITVPLIGLGGIAVMRLLWLQLNGFGPPRLSVPARERGLLNWLLTALGGSVLLSVIVLLVFIQNTYRYLADASLAGILFALLFIAQFRLRIADRSWERQVWQAGWRLAAVLTPLVAVLITIEGYAGAFAELNPGLYDRLFNWFP